MSNKKKKIMANGSKNSQGEEIFVCPPDRAGRSLPIRIFGKASRAMLAMFAVLGLAMLFADAINLNVGALSLFNAAFFSTVFFALFFIPKVGVYLGCGTAAIYLTVKFILDAEYLRFLIASILTVYNTFLERLASRDFMRLTGLMASVDDYGYTKPELQKYGIAVIIFLLAAVFIPCIIKKVRIIFPAAISILILGIVFTYNLSNANWAIVLIIASYCGIIVIATFDKHYIKDPELYGNSVEAQLFGGSDRPPLPDETLIELARQKESAEMKRNERQRRAELRKKQREKTLTVEDEITDYFVTPSAKKAKKKKEHKKKSEVDQIELDNRKKTEKQIKLVKRFDRISGSAKSAMGGIAGIGAFILIMLVLVFPALFTDSSFTEIPGISNQMEFLREYITAFLQGDELVLDDLNYARMNSNFKPRSTDATDRVYDGTQFFFIETKFSNDIYMPGWIATEYHNGSWYTAEYMDDTFNEYRSLYASVYDHVSSPSESVYFNFMNAFVPYDMREKAYEDNEGIIDSKNAVVVEQVNIRRLATIGPQCYYPSKFNLDYKLREYGYNTESDMTFVNFFDGIYTGQGFSELDAQYAVVAYLMTQSNQNWITNIGNYIAEFNEGYMIAYNSVLRPRKERIKLHRDKEAILEDIVTILYSDVANYQAEEYTIHVPEKYIGKGNYSITEINDSELSNDDVQIAYEIRCQNTGVIYNVSTEGEVFKSKSTADDLPFVVRYCGIMSQAEKLEVAEMFYDYFIYSDFVYDTYTKTAGSEIISDYYDDIIFRLSKDEQTEIMTDGKAYVQPYGRNSLSYYTYENRHQLVMKIISTLADPESGYKYTLTPDAEPDAELDGVENFLTVTKEGYCVQFASAVVLLLREAGIPARYVEGFVASDLQKYQTNNESWDYYSIVRDENEHAWVEVWYDGIGWVQYEATPNLYAEAYGFEDPPTEDTTEPAETTTNPEDDTTNDTEITTVDTEVITSLTEVDGQIGSNSNDNRVIIGIWITVVSLIIVATAVSIGAIVLTRRAEKRRNQNEELLRRAENHETSEDERHTVAKKLIDMTMELLRMYGTPPGKSEFRSDYAKRIENEYLGIFGKSKRVVTYKNDDVAGEQKVTEFITVSDTDFISIFESMAAEEFGTDGMTSDELAALAVFYKRLYRAMPARMTGFAIFRFKYFNFTK